MLSRTFGSVFRSVGGYDDDGDDLGSEPPVTTTTGASIHAPIELRAVVEGENECGYGGVCLRASYDGTQPMLSDRLTYQVRHERLDDILVFTDPELAVRIFLGSLEEEVYQINGDGSGLAIRAFIGAHRSDACFCGTEYEIKHNERMSETSVRGVIMLLNAHTHSPIRIVRARKRSRAGDDHSNRKRCSVQDMKRDPDQPVQSVHSDMGSDLVRTENGSLAFPPTDNA